MAVAMLSVLAACTSAVDRANAYEALYDQLMPVKAYPAALSAIQTAVKKDENEPRRWLKLGQVLLLMNRTGDAAVALKHALDLQPDNVGAMENLSILAVRANQFDMAKRFSDPLLLIQPTNLAGLLAAGMIALHERRFGDADQIGDTLVTNYPDRADGAILKARILDARGLPRAGAALLAKRAAQDPTNAELNQQLLALYQKSGDLGGVQDTAIRLAASFPDDARYALESARAWHARGRDDRADAAIAGVLSRFGGNPSAMTAVAGYWRETLAPEVARDRIRRAAAARPGVKAALASILIDMGDPSGAAALLAPLAPPTVTADNVDAQGRYARALLQAGRTADAEAKIKDILAYDSANPDGLLLRARIALARRKFLDAITDAQLVVRDDSRNEEAALLVAQVYAAQGNVLLAAGAYGSARSDFPNSIAVIRAETQWLLSQNRVADAKDRAASFVDTHPRRGDGWALYADLCARTQDSACLAKAKRALAPTA